MKKKIAILSILISICAGVLIGCSDTKEAEPDQKEIRGEEMSMEAEVETEPESEPLDTEEEPELQDERKHETVHASTVLEDENAVYFCGNQHILKWDKATQTTDIIWMTDKEKIKEDAYAYKYTRGILIEDKIYFIESWLKDPVNPTMSETLYALSVVSTDGSSYQEIEEISYKNHLLLLDGILYFSYEDDPMVLEGYVVDADGNLMVDSGKVVTEPVNIPEGYKEPYYYNNGSQKLTAIESAYRFGCYLLRDDNYDFCRVNQNTGKKEETPEGISEWSLISWNNSYLLVNDYSDDNMYLVDLQTWEKELLIERNYSCEMIGMDEEYVYWKRYESGIDFSQYIYERINIETGMVEELFVLDTFEGMLVEDSASLIDVCLMDDYIYYIGVQDYKYYLMRRNVNMPNAEEIIGDAFYDSGISEVGTIKSYKEAIYSENDPELQLAELDLEWLVVDDRFPGASQINALLEEEQNNNMAYERELAMNMEEWTGDGIICSLSSNVSKVYYFNERFISFTQQAHDYTGGAHGMSYWIPHTFDLETGNALGLRDIIANSEEELKDIVTAKFTEMYNVNPDTYWDDSVESVYEWTTMDSAFYLSEEGIVFYHGPYDLAPYSAWFQEIVVPYSEFELFIPLGD